MELDRVTTVLAIRHGETDWNRETRIQGQLDIPLNARGRAQAQRLTQALAGEAIAAVYASDLARARQTALALASTLGQELCLDAGLRERAFGHFEGQTWAEIEQRWPEDALRWRRREPAFGPGGGERLQDFYQRAVGTVERLAGAHPGQTVVVLTHGGVLDCLYRAGQGLELQAPRSWVLGNAAINRLLHTAGGLQVMGWNDDLHLADLRLDEQATA